MWVRALFRQASIAGSNKLFQCNSSAPRVITVTSLFSKSCFATRAEREELYLRSINLNPPSEHAPYTLTKEQEMAITKNDPNQTAKLSELLLKLYLKREQGESLPPEIRIEDFESMIDLRPVQLKRMLRHLWKRSSYQKKEMIRKEEHNEAFKVILEERKQKKLTVENPWLEYQLFGNTLFSRIFKSNMSRFYDAYTSTGLSFGQKIVIDCSYDAHMDDMRIKNTAKQILYCYVYNRQTRRPFALHLCNLDKDSRLMYWIRRMSPQLEYDCPVGFHSGSYLNLFEKKKLVYLSPHTTQILKYNPDDIYIMGALVDKDTALRLSNKKAAKEGIRYAALPLERYANWKKGGKSLCLHHVFGTLLQVKNDGDWRKALQENLPSRKADVRD